MRTDNFFRRMYTQIVEYGRGDNADSSQLHNAPEPHIRMCVCLRRGKLWGYRRGRNYFFYPVRGIGTRIFLSPPTYRVHFSHFCSPNTRVNIKLSTPDGFVRGSGQPSYHLQRESWLKVRISRRADKDSGSKRTTDNGSERKYKYCPTGGEDAANKKKRVRAFHCCSATNNAHAFACTMDVVGYPTKNVPRVALEAIGGTSTLTVTARRSSWGLGSAALASSLDGFFFPLVIFRQQKKQTKNSRCFRPHAEITLGARTRC